jgi:xanthine dehydrogenase YagS FAD-binding subunit
VRPFRYERATDAATAVALLGHDRSARFLGGGTNLVDLMRLGVETPGLLVDVRELAGADVTETADGGLAIGGAVPNSDLAAHPLVRERAPLLASALLHGASGQLRNRATTAGNLLQRTRCVYFQDPTTPCNKRAPGSGCPAIAGDHRNLAILGWSEQCVATHPSDMAVALIALDALVHVEGRAGRRTLPLDDLYRLPGNAPKRDTELGHDELITAVELPPPPVGASRYAKVRERASFSFAVVAVAAVLAVEDGTVRDVRIALGGVAHRPWRARTAERMLLGGPATPQRFDEAAAGELRQARPLRDNGHKQPLARNLIAATLTELAEVA